MSKRFSRNYEQKSEYRIIHIFTEGTETEPNYFRAIKDELRLNNIDIRINGLAFNTLSLVDYAIDFKNTNGIEESDEIWVVFDKDEFDKRFDGAINKAEAHDIKVAYSNESFELWFLLHFNYIDCSLTRGDYNKKLDENLSKLTNKKVIKYNKNSKDIYSLIKNNEKGAIKRSKKLLESYGDEKSFLKKNPSTTVHVLVENLRKLKS